MTPGPARDRFQSYPLDGALLWFHPQSGLHVRLADATTRALRRAAPRVAMFGITNACNLACAFCSRDAARPSLWTVESAAAALRGLAAAGTLEVAFGGGEPLAFRGFAELVEELHATTALALHVTTNGTLLRAPVWRRLEGRLGAVRLSIYDGVPWREPAALLGASGQLWGANLLVDEAALEGLPALLDALHAHGCHDVSLLSFVGPRDRQLGPAASARLAAIIEASPLPCRLSVCFGDRVPAPRLFAGLDNDGDCGAGYDFVSITPDQRVQSCSFQDVGVPAATAEEILSVWRARRAQLLAPSPRPGCARALPLATPAPLPPVAVWRSFSGNNSGECILVARFATVEEAERYVAELQPGWAPDEPYSEAWRALFKEQRVAAFSDDGGQSPRELAVIGATALALSYDAGDAFPELRALAWKRGAEVAAGGVHVHDGMQLVCAVRARDRDDARALVAAPLDARARRNLHGEVVLVRVPFYEKDAPETLAELRALVRGFAGERPVAAELASVKLDDADVVAALQRLGQPLPRRERLWVAFWGTVDDADGPAQAARFARALHDEAAVAIESGVLVDPPSRRARLAVLAHRHRGHVVPLDGVEVRVVGRLMGTVRDARNRQPPPDVDPAALQTELGALLPRGARLSLAGPDKHDWQGALRVRIDTDAPGPAMQALAADAARRGLRVTLGLEELDPAAQLLRRLLDDVR